MIPACFACHVDCAACTTEDQVAPFEYDHPPNFEDDSSHDEELTSPKRGPDSEVEGEMGSAHGYVSVAQTRRPLHYLLVDRECAGVQSAVFGTQLVPVQEHNVYNRVQ